MDGKVSGDCHFRRSPSNAILDGEICALDENGAPDFAALQATLVVVYFAFDLLIEGDEEAGRFCPRRAASPSAWPIAGQPNPLLQDCLWLAATPVA